MAEKGVQTLSSATASDIAPPGHALVGLKLPT